MSNLRQQTWVIAYDSPSNRRRRKLAKLLEGYGLRVQWSVFECRLRHDQLEQLQRRLQRLIVPAEDSVRLWPVPERSCAQVVQLGRPVGTTEWHDRLI
ncbi:MAG: CRISPR-associated endonuclease Cas2 [Synechococcaceae cyanobacterium]|jgi:CRISPR-associated protein Cas2